MAGFTRRTALGGITSLTALAAGGWWFTSRGRRRPPNIVLIVTDDQGYNDLGCYYQGSPHSDLPKPFTPRIDALASQGLRLTDFSVAASICTPSRAALLTGCYPPRVGFGKQSFGRAQIGVFTPKSPYGLHPEEDTIADVLQRAGYATGCIGKWHLGHDPAFLPTAQGFDGFYGIPYSHNQRPLPLMRDDQVLRWLPDEPLLTKPWTQAAVTYMRSHQDQPFFLYLAHSAPHYPYAVIPEFEGRSDGGQYGDVIAQIDWSVGAVLDEIDALGLTQDTLVLFTSDNGPWLHDSLYTGSAWPYRGGKTLPWEGGFRTPFLARWPGVIPAGQVSDEPLTALDLLPTLAGLAGARLSNRPIDGHDCRVVLTKDGESPREDFAYYARGRLEAVRQGPWKLVLENPKREPPISEGLYHLDQDPEEGHDRRDDQPAVVQRLRQLAQVYRTRLGDALTGIEGTECRPLGQT